MSHAEGVSNKSGNRSFDEVLKRYLSRRTVLKGGLAAASVSTIGFFGLSMADDRRKRDDNDKRKRRR